ncbi:pentapeptide repeat-containing protein [Campylobacter coli]|nr:pentapeptide repeat-containing protein [Campylobacter coli]EBF5687519.1 pentapeptide repeat-containing protein [Campylobacter coli]MHM47343.1 pentapeptide repeat-containing protein [Campylobacter coli]
MGILKRLDETIIIEDDRQSEKELVEYCILEGISLNDANLENLNLSGLDFDNVFINGASFKNANLNDISSKNTSFIDCDFSGASFNFCNFLRTEFENCIFENVDLRDCIGDMKNIFSVVVDTYVMTFTKTMMNLGCDTKTIKEWRNLSVDDNHAKELTIEIIRLENTIKPIKEKLESLKKELIALANGEKARCLDITIYPQSRTTIDYKGFLEFAKLEVPREYMKQTTSMCLKIKKGA